MSIEFVFLIFSLIAAFALMAFAYFYNKSASIWHYVKASNLEMNLFQFLYHYIEMYVRGIPASLIYKLIVSARKGGAVISIDVQKDFYKLIDREVALSVYEFNQSYSEGEIRLKRIGGFYLLSGSVNNLIKRLVESVQSDQEIVVQGVKKNRAEKAKFRYLEAQLKAYRKSILNIIESTNLEKDSLAPTKKFEKKEDEDSKDKEQNELLERIEKFFAADLLSEFKENRIYMSKGDNIKRLKEELFDTSSRALIKAQQAGLNIRYADLEVYFGLNGDIESTVEALLKAKHLGLDIGLEDVEKFIISGGDIQTTLTHLIDAKNAGVEIKLKDLEKYHLLGGNIGEVVNALIMAHQEGVKDITIKGLSEYLSQGGNVNELTSAVIKLRQEGINTPISVLNSFRAAGSDVIRFALGLIKAKQSNIEISLPRLRSFLAQGGDIVKLINVWIKTKNSGIDLTFEDYESLSRIGADIGLVFLTFKIVKFSGLLIEKEKLMDIELAGGSMFTYVKALSIAKRLKIDVDPGQLEADVIEKRNVIKVIFAVNYARKEGVEFTYKRGIRLDREGHDVNDVVSWAVNPSVIDVVPEEVLSKDGISMKLFPKITVRGKIDMFLRGSREEVLTNRVNEAIVKEVEQYNTFTEVMESLDDIAVNIYKRLNAKVDVEDFPYLTKAEIKEINNKEEILNMGSAFEVIDVSIPKLEIGSDSYAEIKKEHAEISKIIAKTKSEQRKAEARAKELEAKAKLIEAEAKLNEGMAHAFKKGKMDTKEYYKKKEIFKDENSDIFGHEHESEH